MKFESAFRQSRRNRQLDSNRNLDLSDLNLELNTIFTLEQSSDISRLNSSFLLSSESTNMAHDPDAIYKVLRPVPEFDGNPNVLTRFIKICDQIVITYMCSEPGSELSNLCLINGILNKITGPAASIINANGIPDNWLDIRNALINNFADQRDETALYNDLSLATQGQKSPQEFYDHCQTLFSTIMTYVSLHESIATTIEAKRALYRKLTMQAFVRGLQEPLGSRIWCMRPETIEKALEYVQEELNIMYLQQRNDSVSKIPTTSKMVYPSPVQIPKPSHLQPPVAGWPSHTMQRLPPQPPQPFRFAPQQGFRPNPSQNQHQPQVRMPSRTQQMFSARPANYNPQSNVFRLPQRNQPSTFVPRPMSGVQHFNPKPLPPTTGLRGHDWRTQGNPPPTNYFKTREMNMNECYDGNYYCDYNYDPYYEYHSQIDETYDYNNYNDYSNYERQLPYIQISNPPLKLLIDTGANQSFINPQAIETYYSETPLNYDPFEVTNVHATTRNNYSITLPCFPEFNDNENIRLFVYNFHDFFDGLIGLDLLTKWEAKIDLKDRTLITRSIVNPIRMYNSRNVNLYEDIIPARSSKLVRLPINAPDGEVFIPEQMICNCVIVECLTTVTNSRGYLEVHNLTDNDAILSLDDFVSATVFNLECDATASRAKDVISRLRTDHLNEEEKVNLISLCSRYADVFYIEGEPLSFTNKIKHRINTADEIPVYTKSYRYPFIHRQEVKEQIEKMLSQGIIHPSESAWSSPIWVVPKKADASGKRKWRIVVDFRKVNEKTIDDKYQIPNIADVLDKLGNCQYFSTLDLASGFYQVEMNPADIQKTAFNVEHGHFEFLRMPMGLKNSPSTFQRVMDNVLRELQNTICLVYLDDIIVFSTSLQEHIVNLEKVFQKLRESNFKIQMDKSEFLKLETAYLGHIISKDGIKPNPDKISAIQNYPLPKTPTEIKCF
ncbi:unnamed protein product [Chilo suppressalis]|uniref:Reverse transcriptase domain-containing protein n=1 Tax=Chilo suppressalis TaxID=168631 RepID=A0ABN8BE71_CHISP|nr:unnamed protein product [Chilo suppressalis]